VFLVENNQYAISTPQSMQMAIENVADRAAGYGIPGVVVDGLDPIATYAAVKEALDRARSGGGPSIVEAKVYRFLAHSTDDDDRTYRDRTVVEAARQNDPVPCFERLMLAAGIIDEAGVGQLKAEVLREANDATDTAELAPFPEPEDLYTNVYEGTYEPWL
jgi:2-oxoisovalerate dehydrogenase E1 component alpha subunit